MVKGTLTYEIKLDIAQDIVKTDMKAILILLLNIFFIHESAYFICNVCNLYYKKKLESDC